MDPLGRLRDALSVLRHRLVLADPLGRWRRAGAAVGLVILALAGVTAAFSARPAGPTVEGPGPRRVELPELPPLPDAFEGVTLATHLAAGPGGAGRLDAPHIDELLASPVLDDPDFTRAVHGWIGYWTGPASEWFPGFLARMAWLGPTVDSALAASALPPSMRYLPLIESGYDPRVRSRAQAVGLWQLMTSTAADYGLEVGDVVDERRSVQASTAVAVRYLSSLHERFDSWFLALAAYNSGPARVREILRTHAPGQPPSDSLFWALRAHFPRETREFMPKLYGAMWVASRPEAYGYARPEVDAYDFELVSVPDATTLHVVALAAGADYDDVVRLNPEYVQAVTPANRESVVRLPSGRARTFLRIYPRIHPAERVTVSPDDGPPAP